MEANGAQSILLALGSDLRGDVLVNGCWFWMIQGVCQAHPLWGQEVRCPLDRVMVKDVILGLIPSGSHATFAIF